MSGILDRVLSALDDFGTVEPVVPERAPGPPVVVAAQEFSQDLVQDFDGLTGTDAWHAGVYSLPRYVRACPEIRNRDWPQLREVMIAFIVSHGERAHALGWKDYELFGVHPKLGTGRVDCCGALLLTGGVYVSETTADHLTLQSGVMLRRGVVSPSVPVWHFGRTNPVDRA